MERIHRVGEGAEIGGGADAPVLLFPVRHHSPVCSWQLLRVIEDYRPEVILIEGPEDANGIIPVLTDENTEAPVAIYYYYKDRKKLISPDGEDYRCYYPFLNSSPEYNAMKAARRLGIEARFIDLPYYEILINTEGGRGLRREGRQSYADDGRLTKGRYYQQLCEKTHVRSFEEFWEKYFEISLLGSTAEEFLKAMNTYCGLVRSQTPAEELSADGTLVRERCMALNIKAAMQEHSRVLVVTGGFHTSGLSELLKAESIKPVKRHKVPEDCTGRFPAAYSYEAADALHGYSSGMRHPYFYDCVFKRLRTDRPPFGIYDDEGLTLLVKAAREAAKQELPVSVADVTAARSLAVGLAALRGIREPGMAEITDAVTAAYIKGERTVSTSLPLEILGRLATGDGIGRIGDKAHIPPLVADLEAQCALFKLKHGTAVPQRVECGLFTSAKGLQLSRFLHRMRYLETRFCEREKGPDLHGSGDRARVREVWTYCRTPAVDAVLIDRTIAGFTIEEACRSIAAGRLKSESRIGKAAHTAVDCFLMGISIDDQSGLLTRIAAADGDFFSAGEALTHFRVLLELERLYEYEDSTILPLLTRCFDKLALTLPAAAAVPDDLAERVCSVMKQLFALTDTLLTDRRGMFTQALLELTEQPVKHPAVYGAAMGLLCAVEPDIQKDAEAAMRSFLGGDLPVKKQGAEYLKGLFSTARDIVFAENDFLVMTDELLTSMSSDDFMEILPSLRLAFSYFTPQEISETAEAVAGLYSTEGDSLLYGEAIDEGLYAFGQRLDAEIMKELGRKSR